MYSTVKKSIDLLEILAMSPHPMGVTELSRQLSLPKSNVFRILDTYVKLGYVKKIEGPARYELTLRIWQFGTQVHSRLTPAKVAHPFMRELAETTGETIHLSIFESDHVVYVDQIESRHPVRAYSRIGGVGPAFCTATGKAMLAFLPHPIVDAVIEGLAPHTLNTIIDEGKFREELEKIRADGFAVAIEEWRLGVSGLASPIFDSSGQAVAALGISGPAARLTREWCRRTGPIVQRFASAASSELGYQAR